MTTDTTIADTHPIPLSIHASSTYPGNDPRSVSYARHWVQGVVRRTLVQVGVVGESVASAVWRVAGGVSELCTNALQHSLSGCAGGEVVVDVRISGPVANPCIRVEVIDAGPRPDRRLPQVGDDGDGQSGHLDEHGRGICLVWLNADVSRLGHHIDSVGRHVHWFALQVHP